jgi:hypothetical protein
MDVNQLIDAEGNTAMGIAAENCNTKLVRYLLRMNASPIHQNAAGKSALLLATERCKGDVELYKTLRALPAQPAASILPNVTSAATNPLPPIRPQSRCPAASFTRAHPIHLGDCCEQFFPARTWSMLGGGHCSSERL